MGNNTPQQLQSLNFKGNISRSKLQSTPLQCVRVFVVFVCKFVLNYPSMKHLHCKLLKSLQALLSPLSPSSINKWRHCIFALQAQPIAREMEQATKHTCEDWYFYLMFVWTQRRRGALVISKSIKVIRISAGADEYMYIQAIHRKGWCYLQGIWEEERRRHTHANDCSRFDGTSQDVEHIRLAADAQICLLAVFQYLNLYYKSKGLTVLLHKEVSVQKLWICSHVNF